MDDAIALAGRLVDVIERERGQSVVALCERLYAILGESGIDAEAIVADTRAALVREHRAKADDLAKLAAQLEARVKAGALSPRNVDRARRELAAVPEKERQIAKAIKRIEGRKPPRPENAPTAERLRHAIEPPAVRSIEPDGTMLTAPRHEFRWPVDRLDVRLTAEEYQAAERIREAFVGKENRPRVADWNGSGGGSPGSRAPIADAQLAAASEWNAVYYRTPPWARLVVFNFILETRAPRQSRLMTAEEFGRMWTGTTDARRAQGATEAAIKGACATTAWLFDSYDHWRSRQRLAFMPAGGDRW